MTAYKDIKPPKLKAVSVLDLTVQQVADIENDLGLPINKWQEEAPSMATLYAKILSKGTGQEESVFLAMTMGELIDSVSFDDEDEATDPNA